MELEGRIALLTGAATGLGRAIAEAYAAAGARVVLLDRNGAAVTRVAEAVDGWPVEIDLRDLGAVTTAVDAVAEAWGAPAILVNNAAARTRRAKITELDPAEWETALAVNVTGAFNACRAVIPHMASAGAGVIVNVASQLGSVAAPGAAAYCTTKGALLQLTRALALDHAADGIRVVALSPGAVMTDRLEAVYGSAEAAAALAPLHPIGRIARPDEIADAAVFLASDRARFMTGAELVVDGGYLAQ